MQSNKKGKKIPQNSSEEQVENLELQREIVKNQKEILENFQLLLNFISDEKAKKEKFFAKLCKTPMLEYTDMSEFEALMRVSYYSTKRTAQYCKEQMIRDWKDLKCEDYENDPEYKTYSEIMIHLSHFIPKEGNLAFFMRELHNIETTSDLVTLVINLALDFPKVGLNDRFFTKKLVKQMIDFTKIPDKEKKDTTYVQRSLHKELVDIKDLLTELQKAAISTHNG